MVEIMGPICALRKDFPFFTHNDAIYLDSAATAHKPSMVLGAMNQFYEHENAPVYRGVYGLAESATAHYEQVRASAAEFIHASSADEIVFTRGATDGSNIVAHAWSSMIKPGDHIVVSVVEHLANSLPWQRLAEQRKASYALLPLDQLAVIGVQGLLSYITSVTKLLAVTLDSNVIGPIDYSVIRALIDRAHEVGARVFIDAAQAAPHQEIDVQKLGCDFLVISGHKLFGPTGSGILYIRETEHEYLVPYQVGGGMVAHIGPTEVQWKAMPLLLEAGSPSLAQVVGLGAALEYMRLYVNYEYLQAYELLLMQRLYQGLAACKGIRILGYQEARKGAHLVSFIVNAMHAHDVAAYLATQKICVRAGYHCCPLLHQRYGVAGSVRVSVALYTTIEEIDACIEAIDALTKRPVF